jgi:hypothetical protein
MPQTTNDAADGYAHAAPLYWNAGWRGILPLHRGYKKTPPTGYTGKTGTTPSYPDICAWADLYPHGNLCLRLPDNIIGIDVDAYGAKTGADTFLEAQQRWGILPPTVRSTSRSGTESISGIRLYRTPPGLSFIENIEFSDRGIGDIEIIQHKHRYVLAWPSIHPENRMYQWLDPDGNPTTIPHPEQLPQLPQTWLQHLTQPDDSANVSIDSQKFHTPNALTAGDPSALVAARLRQAIKELNLPGQSRHITARGHVLALLRLGKTGEHGVKQALILLGETFIAFVAKDRAGGTDEARREYRAMILGPGAATALAQPSPTDWTRQLTTEPPPQNNDETAPADPHPIWGYHPPIDGNQFIFGQPDTIPALWGEKDEVLWISGEAFMIAGGMGLGKTTLAGQLLKAQLCGGTVLGLPVTPINGNILYLAMDRPRQIARSLRRQFDTTHQEQLRRLFIRPGPPPIDLAADPARLCRMADEVDATAVYIDSLKDAAVPLSKDEIGAAYNRARQFTLNHDHEICELHHNRKPAKDTINGVHEIYGSVWLAAGCGSIVNLIGEPGDPIIEFRHIKQPLDEVGPYRLLNDIENGIIEIEHEIDLLTLTDTAAADGLTATGAAAALFGCEKPSRAQEAKARRRLDRLTASGHLTRIDGNHGGATDRTKTAWFRRAPDTGWANA